VAAQVPARRWQRYRILEGRKGPIVAAFVALRAVASRSGYREGLPGPEVWVLIRRAVPATPWADGQAKEPALQYSRSNAPVETPLAELIRICGMRWAIECCCAEGQGARGLDDDALRSWPGWQHHMTLVILAHHFLVRLRQHLMDRGHPRPAAPVGAREGGHKTARSRRAPRRTPVAAAAGPAPQPR